jgi:hypothetical protein
MLVLQNVFIENALGNNNDQADICHFVFYAHAEHTLKIVRRMLSLKIF